MTAPYQPRRASLKDNYFLSFFSVTVINYTFAGSLSTVFLEMFALVFSSRRGAPVGHPAVGFKRHETAHVLRDPFPYFPCLFRFNNFCNFYRFDTNHLHLSLFIITKGANGKFSVHFSFRVLNDFCQIVRN